MKIVVFVVIAISLASLASMLLDPGVGRADDESRRATHPTGFSMVVPRGWSVKNSIETSGPRVDAMAILEPVGVGVTTTITVTRLPPGYLSDAERQSTAQATIFQGQPARMVPHERRKSYVWTIAFNRAEDGGHYEIEVVSGLPLDMEHGPLRPFLDSFRPSNKPAPTATTAPTTVMSAVAAG